jgi:putative membrane protein
MTTERKPEEDPRVRFAAEQNLLAWIRTGVSMMGFGFVVSRFGIFLQEVALATHGPPRSTTWSLGFGVALILLGVAVNLFAALEFRAIVRRIESGEAYRAPRWSLGLVSAILLGVLGVGMAGYLIVSGASAVPVP